VSVEIIKNQKHFFLSKLISISTLTYCYCAVVDMHTTITTHTYIHTYHSRFIPEGVAEVSQIVLRDTHVLPKLVSYEEQYVTGGKPIVVLLQHI
jgi:hypothetical protein